MNVVGTVNVFEAAKAAEIQKVVYASSIAVYGGKDEYEGELLPHHALANPHTHYGVFKQANEGTARIYWQDDGIASIGLRPYTLYGPGRDQGLTSTPTQAMLAASARRKRTISPMGGIMDSNIMMMSPRYLSKQHKNHFLVQKFSISRDRLPICGKL